jgi:O-methyltransferase involved in polyketide biosynthesis
MKIPPAAARYLTAREASETFRRLGALSAVGSALFFDAISASYVRQGIVPWRQ